MTVLTESSSRSFVGNGVATVYPTGFPFLANADLTVTLDDVVLTEGIDYTVTGAGDDTEGDVTMLVAPANAAALYIERNTPALQDVALRAEGDFLPATHEEMFDKVTMMIQEDRRRLDALEALGAALASPNTGSITFVEKTFLTDANDIEATFPLSVAVVGGSTATGGWAVRLRNLDDGTEVFDTPPAIQFAPGAGDTVSVKRCAGLKPATNYTLRIAVALP